MPEETIRSVLLEVISELSQAGPGHFQAGSVLREAKGRLKLRGDAAEQALLTVWHDLFRSGYLAPGHNLDNPNPPFCHLTAVGRKVLETFSRDPANPDGYLHHLTTKAVLGPVANSYIREALRTYNADCHKSAAVMLGGAAECIVLELRDTLVSLMNSRGEQVPKPLTDWRVKQVLSGIESVVRQNVNSMPRELRESFESLWSAFTHEVRSARNDAGHPVSVDPVTQETVHANLLMFPQLAALANNLITWAKKHYS